MRTQVIDARKDMLDEILERAVASGELEAGTDAGVVNEVLSGHVLQPPGHQRRADR